MAIASTGAPAATASGSSGKHRARLTKLVKQPLNGGRPEEIATFEDELFDFGYAPDGQTLAVTRGGWQHDVILIRDFNLR
jgi:hypothetical protein